MTQPEPYAHELPPVTEPTPGFKICTMCGGKRKCWLCEGDGVTLNGKRCEECFGRKRCAACDGSGMMRLGIV